MRFYKDGWFNVGAIGVIHCKMVRFHGVILEAKGGKSRAAPTQTVTQKSGPWSAQKPYLKEVFKEAQQQYRGPKPTFYPGQTYADFTPQMESALGGIEQRAQTGTPSLKAAEDLATKTLSGDFLYGGEGFNKALQAAERRVLPQIESRFAGSGRFGSGLSRQAEAQALGDAFAGQYGQERALQQQMAGMAPQLAQAGYSDLNQLAKVGALRQQQDQRGIDEAMARHQFQQNAPKQQLRDYLQMIQGNYGGEQTQTTTGFKGNPAAGILGGALGGAQIGAGFGPYGAAGGAALGGLLGGIF